MLIWAIYVCVNRSLDCEVWPNYEVVEFQPRSVIVTVLESVAYCYVFLPWLPWYHSSHIIFHTSSSSHPGVAHLHTSISSFRQFLWWVRFSLFHRYVGGMFPWHWMPYQIMQTYFLSGNVSKFWEQSAAPFSLLHGRQWCSDGYIMIWKQPRGGT